MMRHDLIVLSVDDDTINRKLLNSFLMKNGFVKEIIEAKNGAEAIQVLKLRDDIDIIFLDIVMPIMNGLEMIQIVRADTNLVQLPIIVLTTDETKKNEALEYGANEFLMKPIRYHELLKKMDMVI